MTEALPSAPFLSLDNIRRSFSGVQALDGVSLDVLPGEVHTLAGENGSGKSTLIKIIAGVVKPHAGEIRLAGRAVTSLTPRAAIAHGIQVIYQDLSLFPNLSVADNLALNTLVEHGVRFPRRRDIRAVAERALEALGVHIDLTREVANLPIAERQLVAIARALVQDARLVVLDEPTTALTSVEVASLFRVVRRMQAARTAILFVSHKIHEMREISDRFTVLRNGRVADAGPAPAFDRDRLARAMTGRTVARALRPTPAVQTGTPVLRVQELAGGMLERASFDLARGQVLGITGLLGAGQAELGLMLAGALRPAAGRIEVDGTTRRFRSIRDAVRAGVAYVPADRLREGLFLDQSIVHNVVAATLRKQTRRFGLVSLPGLAAEAGRWAAQLGVRVASIDAAVRTLSGGNQQRVVLAKWLAIGPRVLVLNGPTVGVDIGAKEGIHALVRRLADSGLAIVMISDDLEELVEHADRVLVLAAGAVVADLSGAGLTEDALAATLATRH